MGAPEIRVVVVYSPGPRTVHEFPVRLAAGSTVLHALQACGLQAVFPEVDPRQVVVGVWGREAQLEQVLREFDRVEIYRPLKVDPKVARRERFRKQGVRAAGLFARSDRRSRPG